VELRGEESSCYLNNIQSVGLWRCLYDHYLANKAYFSAITVKTYMRVLPTRWRRKPAGIEITSLSPYVYIKLQWIVHQNECLAMLLYSNTRQCQTVCKQCHKILYNSQRKRKTITLLWTHYVQLHHWIQSSSKTCNKFINSMHVTKILFEVWLTLNKQTSKQLPVEFSA